MRLYSQTPFPTLAQLALLPHKIHIYLWPPPLPLPSLYNWHLSSSPIIFEFLQVKMHAMKFLSALALAPSVSATLLNGAHVGREVLQVRQTSAAATATVTASTNSTNSTNSARACSSVAKNLATLIQEIPEPSGSLSTFLATAYSTMTNPCAVTIPKAISSTYLVYGSAVLSFYSVNEVQIASALAICPSITSVAAFPICASLLVAPASATPTMTTSKNSTASPTSSPIVVSTAGARDPRESGLMAAALAVAGMVGAMAVAL
jgi:hypothetical protein